MLFGFLHGLLLSVIDAFTRSVKYRKYALQYNEITRFVKHRKDALLMPLRDP